MEVAQPIDRAEPACGELGGKATFSFRVNAAPETETGKHTGQFFASELAPFDKNVGKSQSCIAVRLDDLRGHALRLAQALFNGGLQACRNAKGKQVGAWLPDWHAVTKTPFCFHAQCLQSRLCEVAIRPVTRSAREIAEQKAFGDTTGQKLCKSFSGRDLRVEHDSGTGDRAPSGSDLHRDRGWQVQARSNNQMPSFMDR